MVFLALLSFLSLSAVSCGEPPENASPDVAETADTGVGEDVSDAFGGETGAEDTGASVDTGPDAGADTGPDGGDAGQEGWSFPEPIIAGTPKTDALADDPDHCGQADYKWLRDGPFGEITDYGTSMKFNKGTLEALAQEQGIVPPREFKYDIGVEQFVYKTQDRGEMIEATGLVGYPKDMEADEPVDVLLILHGTAGFTDDCAPSGSLAGQGLAALFASWGYLVVAPDYIGMKGVGEPTGFLHPYLVGQATAVASLDSVRALAKLPADKRGGLTPSSDVLVFGGSQGGHAALWVDRLAPYYARELNLLGTVATVPPANLLAEGERALDKMVNATGNLIAFMGAASDWYGVRDQLDEVFLSPYDTQVPQALEDKCNPGDGINAPETTDEIFTQSLLKNARAGDLEKSSPWGCMAVENSLTHTRIERLGPKDDSYGILYILGEKDNLVHTPIERKSFETLCNNGMPLEFLECKGAGHVEASFYSMAEILDFMEARQNGEVFAGSSDCKATAAVTCRSTP